jgi:hypothetical protein
VPEVLSCWLCHGANLSNAATRYVFRHSLEDVRHAVGTVAWAETSEQLADLRDRLAGPTLNKP